MSKKKTLGKTAKPTKFPQWVESLHDQIRSWRENFGETDAEYLLNDLAGYWDEDEGVWRLTPAQAAYAYGLPLDQVEDFFEWWPDRGVMHSITQGLAKYRDYKQCLAEGVIGELMRKGITPENDEQRLKAIKRIERECVTLEALQEVVRNALGHAEADGVASTLKKAGVRKIVIPPSDDRYRHIVATFGFPSDVFIDPQGIAILEKVPKYAGLKRNPAWKALKATFCPKKSVGGEGGAA